MFIFCLRDCRAVICCDASVNNSEAEEKEGSGSISSKNSKNDKNKIKFETKDFILEQLTKEDSSLKSFSGQFNY